MNYFSNRQAVQMLDLAIGSITALATIRQQLVVAPAQRFDVDELAAKYGLSDAASRTARTMVSLFTEQAADDATNTISFLFTLREFYATQPAQDAVSWPPKD